MPFAEGENIGPYRIIEQLGQGGMATVYKAYHAALDRYVALKVLHPAFHEEPNFTARFQREARVVARLEHPSIVPVYDYAEQENRPFLVMKYIEGETLKARLSRGPLNAAEITQVVDAVGSALAYAHKQGILHRDIKPSNVLIQNDGAMYLADFGLARIAQAGESTLSSDSIMGTPQYISPEQARGDKDLDAGTDIYSFGVMLYEMVVGQVPFNADTPFSIIHDHIYTPLPLPRSINKQVPESVERVLLKALAKERADRFEDIPALVKAFKAAWETAGVPMQGTALTLPAVTARQAKKEVTLQKEATVQHAQAGKTVVAKEPKKKRLLWPFVATGALLTFCCVFAFVVTRPNRGGFFPSPAPPATQIMDGPDVTEPARPSPEPPQPMPTDLPPGVLEARRKADASPEDPFAQLELSLAYWDAGMQRPAYETLNHAAELAGGDRGFLVEAGNQFHKRQAWIASAAMYLRFIRQTDPEGEIPPEISNNFHEAVFMAAPQPELEVTYPLIEEILKVDQPIGLVAQSRHAYFNGKLDEGRVFLNQVKRLKPGFLEATLLEAEYAVIENRTGEAKLLLQPLVADLDAPEWIRIMAEEFLNRIP
jgi:tRNA A-37 threonylcarbamoyl transferase component Bud32